jgi:hypothetical protein
MPTVSENVHLLGKTPSILPLTLTDRKAIETVGEAAAYFASLTEDQREHNHWKALRFSPLRHSFQQC